MKIFGAEYWQKSAQQDSHRARYYRDIRVNIKKALEHQRAGAEASAFAREEYAKEAETTDWKALAEKKARDKNPLLNERERYMVVIGNHWEAGKAYSQRLKCGILDTEKAIKNFMKTEEYKRRSSKPLIVLT